MATCINFILMQVEVMHLTILLKIFMVCYMFYLLEKSYRKMYKISNKVNKLTESEGDKAY